MLEDLEAAKILANMREASTYDFGDAKMLAKHLKRGENIVFSFCVDKVTSYVMMIIPEFTKFGVLPFGGDPDGYFYVGILRRGFFHFDLKTREMHHGYVGEKLDLGNDDAKNVTDMLNEIGKSLRMGND